MTLASFNKIYTLAIHNTACPLLNNKLNHINSTIISQNACVCVFAHLQSLSRSPRDYSLCRRLFSMHTKLINIYRKIFNFKWFIYVDSFVWFGLNSKLKSLMFRIYIFPFTHFRTLQSQKTNVHNKMLRAIELKFCNCNYEKSLLLSPI